MIPFGPALARGLAAAFLCLAAAPSQAAEPLVREQREVAVQGATESWRLVWDEPPGTVCGAEDVAMAESCPCMGFAYGQHGKLSLVRIREGKQVDRLDLRPLFVQPDLDAPEAEKVEGSAWLQHRALAPGDADRAERNDPALQGEIDSRPPATAMDLADYDRDGAARELLVPVGTLPCGKLQYAAVGLPAGSDRLRALTTRARPKTPLVMPLAAWQALLRQPGPTTVATWACGDHGSDVRSELIVAAQHGRIRVKARDFSCPPKGGRGKLVEQSDR